MTSRRSIVVEDLAALRWAMEPAAHPTDALAAFVVSGPDPATDHLGYDLYIGGPHAETRLVASGARQPRWSPRGEHLAFSRCHNGRWVPAVTDLQSEEWDLEAPAGNVVDLRWEPDGRRIVVVTTGMSLLETHQLPYPAAASADWMTTADHKAWIVEHGGEPMRVGGGLRNVSIAVWSPDGAHLAVVSDDGVDRDTSTGTGIWLWSIASGETRLLVAPTRPIHAVAWAPNGASIAFLAAARDNASSAINELWLVDVASGEARRLAPHLDRSPGRPVRGDDERAIGPPILDWHPDSSGVLALYADGGSSRLGRFGLDGGFEIIEVGQDCVLEFDVGDSGMVFSWSDPVTPGEVSWVNSAGEAAQVSTVGERLLSQVSIAPTERISVVASDGVEVEGWLTLPLKSAGAPLVLQVHGGPHYAVGERFSFDAQRFAARGIAVLRANPRGSQGYGQAFADGNLGDWGGRDLADLLDLVDAAVRHAGLDGKRVGIMGESYGGFISAWGVASTDRFAVAVVENGIADFLSSAGGVIGPTFWHSELGGAPWRDSSIYLERSPITRLDEVDVPVLVVHCEADTTCPIAQGEAMFAGLRQLGAEVEFWRVPGEGHFFNVFGALSRRLARTATIDEFLVRHLAAEESEMKEENSS